MILDFGIRPDDFDLHSNSENKGRFTPTKDFIKSYLAWYPILAACSFIRANPYEAGFHDEYVIPQLLMQWLRRTNIPPHIPDDEGNPPENTEDPLNRMSQYGIIFNKLDDIEDKVSSLRNQLQENPAEIDGMIKGLDLSVSLLSRMIYWSASTHRLTVVSPIPDELINRIERISRNLLQKELNKLSKETLSNTRKDQLGHIRRLLDNAQNNLKWADAKPTSPIIVKGIRYFSCRDFYATTLGRNYVFPAEFGNVTSNRSEKYSMFLADRFNWTKALHLPDFDSPKECEKALNNMDCTEGREALEEKS